MKPLDIVCPSCGASGWCMRIDSTGQRTRANRTHRARIRKARASEELTFTRAPSDASGNPRYVVHFLNLNTREELDYNTPDKYALACKRANTIGGRRYHTKRYGGGIVFQSYSIDETAAAISRVTGRQFVAVEG